MEVKIGQRVGIQVGRSGRVETGYEITKITATGQITATRGGHKVRFNSRGYELGSGYYRSSLITDLTEVTRRIAAQEAFVLVKATGVPMDYRESVRTMTEKLDALVLKIANARVAVANLKELEATNEQH